MFMFWQQSWHRRYRDEMSEGSEGSAGQSEVKEAEKEAPKSESKINESEAKLLKEVMNKKAKIKDLENELSDIKAKISAFDGLDANEIKTLMQEKANAEKAKLEAKGQWDALKEQMAKEHAAEKAAIAKAAEEAREQVAKANAVIERLTLVHQFDSSSFIKDELILTPRKAKAVYGEYFDIDENGVVVGYDKPRGESNRTPLVNGQGDPVDFDEALKRLVESDPDRDELLKAKRRSGAGSSSSTTKVPEQTKKLYGIEKIEAALKKAS